MKIWKKLIILFGILGVLSIVYFTILRCQVVQATSRYGSRGDEVKQIQTKLKIGDIIVEAWMECMEVEH